MGEAEAPPPWKLVGDGGALPAGPFPRSYRSRNAVDVARWHCRRDRLARSRRGRAVKREVTLEVNVPVGELRTLKEGYRRREGREGER